MALITWRIHCCFAAPFFCWRAPCRAKRRAARSIGWRKRSPSTEMRFECCIFAQPEACAPLATSEQGKCTLGPTPTNFLVTRLAKPRLTSGPTAIFYSSQQLLFFRREITVATMVNLSLANERWHLAQSSNRILDLSAGRLKFFHSGMCDSGVTRHGTRGRPRSGQEV